MKWLKQPKVLVVVILMAAMHFLTDQISWVSGWKAAERSGFEDAHVAYYRALWRFHYGLAKERNDGKPITPPEAKAAFEQHVISGATTKGGRPNGNQAMVFVGSKDGSQAVGRWEKEIARVVRGPVTGQGKAVEAQQVTTKDAQQLR